MKVIIIGASSGMGRELAKILAHDGYEIGVVARRQELLASLQKEIHSPIFDSNGRDHIRNGYDNTVSGDSCNASKSFFKVLVKILSLIDLITNRTI